MKESVLGPSLAAMAAKHGIPDHAPETCVIEIREFWPRALAALTRLNTIESPGLVTDRWVVRSVRTLSTSGLAVIVLLLGTRERRRAPRRQTVRSPRKTQLTPPA